MENRLKHLMERVSAKLIDMAVIGIPVLFFYTILITYMLIHRYGDDGGVPYREVTAYITTVKFSLFILFNYLVIDTIWSRFARTPGRFVAGLRISAEEGGVTFQKLWKRNMRALASLFALGLLPLSVLLGGYQVVTLWRRGTTSYDRSAGLKVESNAGGLQTAAVLMIAGLAGFLMFKAGAYLIVAVAP